MGKWFNKNWLFGENSLFNQVNTVTAGLIATAAPIASGGLVTKEQAQKISQYTNIAGFLTKWASNKPQPTNNGANNMGANGMFVNDNQPSGVNSYNYYKIGGVVAVLGFIIYLFTRKKRR